jgi:hypothetical protein
MSFDWLKKFQQNTRKPADYAEKTLAAYRLGMRANGSIIGVRVVVDADGCAACRLLAPDTIYHPDDAPLLPLADCDRRDACGCVYRPAMNYEVDDHS